MAKHLFACVFTCIYLIRMCTCVHVQVCQVKGKKMGKEVREREEKKRTGREGGGEEQVEEGGGEGKAHLARPSQTGCSYTLF